MEKLNLTDWDAMTSTEQQELVDRSNESVLVTWKTGSGTEYSTQIDRDIVPFFSQLLWSGVGRGNTKYIVAQFQGRDYKVNIQLAELVLLIHGKVANKDHEVHHINGDTSDNRYDNIGILHKGANSAMKDSILSRGEYLGISKCGAGRIKARIFIGTSRTYLGSAVDTPENRDRLAKLYDDAWESKFGLPGPNFGSCKMYPVSRKDVVLQGVA